MAKTSTPNPETFIPVKRCYSHVGGQLGNLLLEQFIVKKWIEPLEDNERLYCITTKGRKAFTEMGIDLSLIAEQSIS